MESVGTFEIKSNRLPLEPLMRELGLYGTSELAHRLGVSRWTVLRMKKAGLTIYQADEVAIRVVGTHPTCIWGADFYVDCLEENGTAAMESAA